MQLSNNHAAGIYTVNSPAYHERSPQWRMTPPTALLSEGMRAAVTGYFEALQRQGKLSHERTELFSDAATNAAFRADQEAAADLAPGEDVTTPNLDKLERDRRRVIVEQGGAALACDRALAAANKERHGGDAISPDAAAAADRARRDALALLDKLDPLLAIIAQHAALIRWTDGNPYAPSRETAQFVNAIREDITA